MICCKNQSNSGYSGYENNTQSESNHYGRSTGLEFLHFTSHYATWRYTNMVHILAI